MPDPVTIIGTGSAVGGLISEAIALIRQILRARSRVEGGSATLDGISRQLAGVSLTLKRVQQEPQLQEAAVQETVKAIVNIHKELKIFFDQLATRQERNAIRQYICALKDGDNDDKELAAILNRLTVAITELNVGINVVHFRLTRNLSDSFTGVVDAVIETRNTVNSGIAQNRELILASPVSVNQAHSNIEGTAPGDQDFVQLVSTHNAVAPEPDNLNWYENETGVDATITNGGLGYDVWENQQLPPVKATVHHNKFGKGLKFINGSVGPSATRDLFHR